MIDWVAALSAECSATSQTAAARRLGVSASTVNQVLKGSYKGDLRRIEGLVRGELMRETLACPVLEVITKKRCLDEQRKPFAATNPERVKLYFACRSGCQHSHIRK